MAAKKQFLAAINGGFAEVDPEVEIGRADSAKKNESPPLRLSKEASKILPSPPAIQNGTDSSKAPSRWLEKATSQYKLLSPQILSLALTRRQFHVE